MGVQAAGAVVVGLRGEQSELEVHDLLELRGRRRGALSMAGRRIRSLRQQIRPNRLTLHGLASVPHHRAQEAKVRGRQRPSKHRRLGQRRATVVRIVGVHDLEFGILGHGEADADQAFRQELTVGAASSTQGRDVGALAVRPIVGPEHRIAAVGFVEAVAKFFRRDRPCLRRSMTAEAGPPVRAEVLEERVLNVDCRGSGNRPLHAASVRERQLIGPRFVPRCPAGCRKKDDARHGDPAHCLPGFFDVHGLPLTE